MNMFFRITFAFWCFEIVRRMRLFRWVREEKKKKKKRKKKKENHFALKNNFTRVNCFEEKWYCLISQLITLVQIWSYILLYWKNTSMNEIKWRRMKMKEKRKKKWMKNLLLSLKKQTCFFSEIFFRKLNHKYFGPQFNILIFMDLSIPSLNIYVYMYVLNSRVDWGL